MKADLLFIVAMSSFVATVSSFSIGPRCQRIPTTSHLARHSEFSVEEDGEGVPLDVAGSDYAVIEKSTVPTVTSQDEAETTAVSKRPEYGALTTGTVVQVQIGDLSLARKAWKKRRRTGSPLLVPCSILNADQRSMVRWNLIYLLEKFGKAQADGIQLTGSEMSQRYRTFMKSSLQKQATILGYNSNEEMISDLFNKKVQDSYGIRLVEKKDGELALKAPISRTKAQKRAAATPLLQFRMRKDDEHGDADSLTHTGFIRTRKPEQEMSDKSYHFLPLSAALRVSQKDDVDTGRIEEGSIHPAVVFDYDIAGDAGSPLLTLSLNPRGLRENLKVKPVRKFEQIEDPQVEFKDLKVGDGPFRAKVVRLMKGKALVDMDVGRRLSSEGMLRVMGELRYTDSVEIKPEEKLSHADDFEESFERYDLDEDIEDALFNFDDEDFDDDDEDNDQDSLADDLLSLRSSDSFEEGTFEDGEIEEDVSDLYSVSEDGTLVYSNTGADFKNEQIDEVSEDDVDFDMTSLFQENDDGSVAFIDPESGESLEVESGDEEFEDMLEIKALIDRYSAPPSPKNVANMLTDDVHSQPFRHKEKMEQAKLVSKRLRVGEEVDVYVRTVSKQSGQFTVTTNPTAQGKKAKELKQESNASKKLDRLRKQLGGSLQKIYDLAGEECGGVVRATSQTGEWYYVQPDVDGLPVGVATLSCDINESLSEGDNVRVVLTGVDEKRGQLSMDLVEKS